jgi:hypothetical protein
MSAYNCQGVSAMLSAATNRTQNSIPYSLNFNSNTVAHIMAGYVGLSNLPAPEGASGWNGGN